MLYSFVKIIARLAIPIYCRDIAINRKQLLELDGPLMLAVNHPNSFLDAIILCTLFNKPVYSLARGDAFKSKFFARILYWFKMFPVYRVSEGVENLEENYKTFEQCKDVFRQNGIVLIFSEGKCINEWHLRPLKKGTARLAISSWKEEIDVKVLPVAINYSSFKRFGKNIKLFFGDIISKTDIQYNEPDGIVIRQFNDILKKQLNSYVFEIDRYDKKRLKEKFYVERSTMKKILLSVPATLGFLIHAPLYLFIKWLGDVLNKETEHYDSKIVGLLFILYPVFLILACLLAAFFTRNILFPLVLLWVLPFTAWSFVQLKKQLD